MGFRVHSFHTSPIDPMIISKILGGAAAPPSGAVVGLHPAGDESWARAEGWGWVGLQPHPFTLKGHPCPTV